VEAALTSQVPDEPRLGDRKPWYRASLWWYHVVASPERGVSAAQEQSRSHRDSATGRLLAAYRADGDTRARDRLVELYLPLVEALAQRHQRSGHEHDDLVQAGSIGLLNAIERYDAGRGGEFAAFAVPTITGEMKRHLRDRAETVRLPRRLHEARTALPSAREELTASLGRDPSRAELAAALRISAEDVARVEAARATTLDDEIPEDHSLALEASAERIVLAGAFEELDETDRRIVYLRFVRELSRRDAARELGISEAALARRSEVALTRLRNVLEGRALDAAAPGPAPARRGAGRAKESESRHSGRLHLRMPQSLHAKLAEAAEREDVSLNQFITNALASAVSWNRDTPEVQPSAAPRWLPAALLTNIVMVVIAAVAALALLVIAVSQGL
jgi:RNA polymerase sigma-B factor